MADAEYKAPEKVKLIVPTDAFQQGRLDELSMTALMYYYLNPRELLHKNPLTQDVKEEIARIINERLALAPLINAVAISDTFKTIGGGFEKFKPINISKADGDAIAYPKYELEAGQSMPKSGPKFLRELTIFNEILRTRPQEFVELFKAAWESYQKTKGIPGIAHQHEDLKRIFLASVYTHVWHELYEKSPGFQFRRENLETYKGKFELLKSTILGPAFNFDYAAEFYGPRYPILHSISGGVKSLDSLECKVYNRLMEALTFRTEMKEGERKVIATGDYDPQKDVIRNEDEFRNSLRAIDDVFRFYFIGYYLTELQKRFEASIRSGKHWSIVEYKDTKKKESKDVNFLKYDLMLTGLGTTALMTQFAPESIEVQLYDIAGYVLDKVGDARDKHGKYKDETKERVRLAIATFPIMEEIRSKMKELRSMIKPTYDGLTASLESKTLLDVAKRYST